MIEGREQGDAFDASLFQPRTPWRLKNSGKRFGGRRASVCISGRSVRDLPTGRVQAVHRTTVLELWDHASISLHNGKTKVAVVRRGDTLLPTSRQGLSILETPVGHDDFVEEQLRSRREEHCCSISAVPNFEAAWLLLTFLRWSKFHIEDSPSSIGGRVRSLIQSRHLDMSGEDSWHRRFGSV